MTKVDDLIIIGASGIASVAPVGSTAPTDATSSLDAAFADLGWISDSGLTEAINDNWQTFTPWGATAPVKSRLTGVEKTFQVTFWETNPNTLGLYFRQGGPVSLSGDTFSFTETSSETSDLRAMAFDIVQDSTNKARVYVPRCEVSNRGNIVYKSDTIVGYEVTITAYAGSDGVITHRFGSFAALS